jgi:hypothetical protein
MREKTGLDFKFDFKFPVGIALTCERACSGNEIDFRLEVALQLVMFPLVGKYFKAFCSPYNTRFR